MNKVEVFFQVVRNYKVLLDKLESKTLSNQSLNEHFTWIERYRATRWKYRKLIPTRVPVVDRSDQGKWGLELSKADRVFKINQKLEFYNL